MHKLNRIFQQEEGVSALYMAMVLFLLVGMLGIALDGSNAYLERRRIQTAADFAALAGARALALGGDTTAIDTEVDNLATANGVSNPLDSASGTGVEIGSAADNRIDWQYTNDHKGVEVKLVNHYDPFFARIFGYEILTSTAKASAGYLPVVGVSHLLPIAINGCDCVNFDELPAALAQSDFASTVLAVYTIGNINDNSINYALYLKNVDPTYPGNTANRPYYLFYEPDGQGTLTVYGNGTAHALTQVVNVNGDGFTVDLRFGGRTSVAPDGQSPACDGVCATTTDWQYYPTLTGTLTGLPGTRYAGAVIRVTRRAASVQLGTNAHLKNPKPAYGGAAWLALNVLQQPSTGVTLNSTNQEAILNVLLSSGPVPTPTATPATSCPLYPIALSAQTLTGVAPGVTLGDIWNGVQAGNFGWLTWAGAPDVPTLVLSLTPPGNSQTYINPNQPTDTVVSIGDWVQGSPGVSNASTVRAALDVLKTINITVPVWDQATGNGNNARYRVANFAIVRLTDYQLPNQNRMTATFVGYATNCGGSAPATSATPSPSPTPNPTLSPTLSPTASATPSPTATTAPLPTATVTAAGVADCRVDYQKSSDWGNGFVASIDITNKTGVTYNGWTITWSFSGNQTITNLWGGVLTQTGQSVQVKHADWNKIVPNNGKVTVGFQASYSGTNPKPTNFVVNGVACNLLGTTDTLAFAGYTNTTNANRPVNAASVSALSIAAASVSFAALDLSPQTRTTLDHASFSMTGMTVPSLAAPFTLSPRMQRPVPAVHFIALSQPHVRLPAVRAAPAAATLSCPNNLLLNPSFESGNTNWTGITGTSNNGYVIPDGTKYGYHAGSAGTRMYQDVTAVPGGVYQMTFYSASHVPGSQTVKLEYLTAANATVGTPALHTITVDIDAPAHVFGGPYTLSLGAAPATTAKLRVSVSSNGVDWAKVDALCLQGVTPTATPTPTSTPVPTATPTNTPTRTSTPLPTATPTNTPTKTNTSLPTATPNNAPPASCPLYPIALSAQTLTGVAPGVTLGDIWNGVQAGNFGWLTWAGAPDVPTLVLSLTPPGNSQTYINPNQPTDTVVSIGDWVQGSPGVSNASTVRAALDVLKTINITVPVWDQATGNGNNARYRVANFAIVRLTDYQLPNQNRMTATFVGYATNCGGSAPTPSATPSPTTTPTVTLSPTALPPTSTPVPTATSTHTPTATPTVTPSPTALPPTATPLPTATSTYTPTPTPTLTPTATATEIPSPTVLPPTALPPSPTTPVGSCALDDTAAALNRYTLIVLDDLSTSSDIENRAFVGGNLISTASANIGINVQGIAASEPMFSVVGNLVAGNPLNLNAGSLHLGGNRNNRPINFNGGGTLVQDPTLFDTAITNLLQTATAQLAKQPANNGVSLPTGQPGPARFQVTATTDKGVAIFQVAADDLFGNQLVQQMELTPGAATTVLINVTGSNVDWNGNGNMVGNFTNKHWRGNVIWNFTQATTINFRAHNFMGALLAPYAQLTTAANLDGAVAVRALTTSAEVHQPTFTGNLGALCETTTIEPPERTPCQLAWLDWDGGIASTGELADDLQDPSRSGQHQIGDWVAAGPSLTADPQVVNALRQWLNKPALIVFYDQGDQNNGYQICGFAQFTLTDYDLAALPPWLQGQFTPALIRGLTDPNATDYGLRDLRFK